MSARISIVAALLLSVSTSAYAASQHRKTPRPAPAKAAVEQQPSPAPTEQQTPPPPPPTPEQGPSSPPDVTFQGGQLTIVARNSTMGDVLNAVRRRTGAAVEMPAVSSERVVGQFGPGAPREVLAQLLNGSHYDYVLLGSPAEPGALKKIVLMARASGPEPNPAPPVNNPGAAGPPGLQTVPQIEQDQSSEEQAPEVQPEMPPEQEEQTGEQPQPQQNEGQPPVKTPEQLLRELQQQQQQQQQQQAQPPQ